jgi:hypothetical protein
MMSAIVALLFIVSLAIVVVPAAHAEEVTIPLGYSIYGLKSQVEAHLQYIEIGDDRKGSTQTTTPLERVKWFRLFYQYQNHGDTTADGDLKLLFIDDKGNEYKLDERTYTGDTVSGNSIGTLKFIELPISRDSNIVTIRVYKGFDYTDFTVPQPGTATPTATATVVPTATPTSTATATPTAIATGTGTGSCLPLLPFAILATIGLAGAIKGKKIYRK